MKIFTKTQAKENQNLHCKLLYKFLLSMLQTSVQKTEKALIKVGKERRQ